MGSRKPIHVKPRCRSESAALIKQQLSDPIFAKQFCDSVRKKTGLPTLPDETIIEAMRGGDVAEKVRRKLREKKG